MGIISVELVSLKLVYYLPEFPPVEILELLYKLLAAALEHFLELPLQLVVKHDPASFKV